MPNISHIDPDNNISSRINFKYYTLNEFHNSTIIKQSLLDKGFSVLHSNIRSMSKHFDSLNQMLCNLNYPFHLTGISDTWLKPDNHLNFDLSSYTFLSQPTSQRAGSVGMFINFQIKYHARFDLSTCIDECKTLWVEIENHLDKNILCRIIYRHPNSNTESFFNQLFPNIEKINRENKICFILGDFNINLLNYDNHNLTELFVNTLNLYFF